MTFMQYSKQIAERICHVLQKDMREFEFDKAEGVFTLFAILFFMVSVAIVGIGLIGEYVGRTFQIIQKRPRYILKKVYEATETKEDEK